MPMGMGDGGGNKAKEYINVFSAELLQMKENTLPLNIQMSANI